MHNKTKLAIVFLTGVILSGCGDTSAYVGVKTTEKEGVVKQEYEKQDDYDDKRDGEVTVSEDGMTIYVRGGVYGMELSNKKTKKAKKIVFSKDAHIVNDDDCVSELEECKSYLSKAPFIEKIEVEEGNPVLYEREGMLIEKHETSDGLQIGVVVCMPTKKGKVRIPDEVTYLGKNPFNQCSGITAVYIPKAVTYIQGSDFGRMKSCKEFVVEDENPYFYSEDGVLYEKEHNNTEATLVSYPAGKKDEIFYSSKNIECVDDGAFMGAENLQEVYLPKSCKSIGDLAFAGCKKLEKVEVEGKKKISNVGSHVWDDCSELRVKPKDILD